MNEVPIYREGVPRLPGWSAGCLETWDRPGNDHLRGPLPLRWSESWLTWVTWPVPRRCYITTNLPVSSHYVQNPQRSKGHGSRTATTWMNVRGNLNLAGQKQTHEPRMCNNTPKIESLNHPTRKLDDYSTVLLSAYYKKSKLSLKWKGSV